MQLILKNGNKSVKITQQAEGNSYVCLYYHELGHADFEVLDAKLCGTNTKAIAWANKKLNIK